MGVQDSRLRTTLVRLITEFPAPIKKSSCAFAPFRSLVMAMSCMLKVHVSHKSTADRTKPKSNKTCGCPGGPVKVTFLQNREHQSAATAELLATLVLCLPTVHLLNRAAVMLDELGAADCAAAVGCQCSESGSCDAAG